MDKYEKLIAKYSSIGDKSVMANEKVHTDQGKP